MKSDTIIGNRGEAFAEKTKVFTFVADDVNKGTQLQRQTAQHVTPDFEAAAKTIDALADHLADAHARMVKAMDQMAAGAKDASRKARGSATDMVALLDKIDRGANYDRLERNVATLERAAAAMQVLADLEKTGHLGRIIKALQ